ncbi:hypothetical protein JYB64_08430 [Algoriphagus aestuarii]|nr:hypothetical protein [Algoriphagus aestuarii]
MYPKSNIPSSAEGTVEFKVKVSAFSLMLSNFQPPTSRLPNSFFSAISDFSLKTSDFPAH